MYGRDPSYVARCNGDGCAEHETWLRAALAEIQVLGAVAVVETAPRCVTRAGVIPKSAASKYRIIVDLPLLNKDVHTASFNYETLSSSRSMFNERDRMLSFDLKDGHYHAGMHPSHFTFLGFRAFGLFDACARSPK